MPLSSLHSRATRPGRTTCSMDSCWLLLRTTSRASRDPGTTVFQICYHKGKITTSGEINTQNVYVYGISCEIMECCSYTTNARPFPISLLSIMLELQNRPLRRRLTVRHNIYIYLGMYGVELPRTFP